MKIKKQIAFLCAVSLLFALAACRTSSHDQAPTMPSQLTTDPTVDATAPTHSTSASTEATLPAEDTQSPTAGAPDPTNPTQAPTAATQNPSAPTQNPTVATQISTAAPSDPTEPTVVPTVSTEATQADTAKPTAPTEVTQTPTEATQVPTEKPTTPVQPTEAPLPPSVTIPPATDPENGEPESIAFPCPVPGYNLVIEKLAPYSGMYVEDGTNVSVQNVAMLLLRNNGESPIEFAQLSVDFGAEKLLFDVTALPAGAVLVVQEKYGKAIPDTDATLVSATIVERADMSMSESMVEVTDNGDNTLTIKNLTGEELTTIRVFYKYYMQEEEIFIGGIAFTVRVTHLAPGASVTIQPSHYTSQTCRVVMALTYDSEV